MAPATAEEKRVHHAVTERLRRHRRKAGVCLACGGQRDGVHHLRCSACVSRHAPAGTFATKKDAWDAWYARNHEYAKKRTRDYQRAHKAAVVAKKRARLATEKGRAANAAERRLYYQRHKAKVKAAAAVRKAMLKGAPGRYTAAELRARYDEQGGRCAYCWVPLDGRYHADHVVAVKAGGSSDISNIVCACPPCNTSKRHSTAAEFMSRLDRNRDRRAS